METIMTAPKIMAMKGREKIVALTAYDCTMALLLDASGVDLVLVGDSAAMVFSGESNTLPFTMEEALYHCRAVRRGVRQALLTADMPFLSYQINADQAMLNAGRFFKEAQIDAVKVEGGAVIAETVRRLVNAGMPVMGHLGLTPQSIRRFGGYKLQAADAAGAEHLLQDALALQEAGAFCLVLEKIPAEIARKTTAALTIPTIGIGAGPWCDGQILVTQDLLGLYEQFQPKFVRRYGELGKAVREACGHYAQDVRSGAFPSLEESF
jgi:3-methyl-2-oxobutanoate hydroxymethyltransferase